MMAVVEVDAGQAAKQGKATDEMGQWTTPPPPQTVATPLARRQPTPDHPPYCWMIGEAIDALAEDGGSSEDSISAFICARHPGVPLAHNRLLRHYLRKHVAEGFFVRTTAGLYERRPEENSDEELPVEQAEAEAEAGSRKLESVEAKRGRGRPRRDGAPSSTPAAGRKDGSSGAQWMTPASSPSTPPAAAAKVQWMAVSPVAVEDKDESQAPSLKPKRRRRLRRQGMATTTDSSGEAIVAGKKDGSEVPYTSDKELALVILGDSSATPTMDTAYTAEVPPTKPPVDGGQPLDPALVTTTEVPMLEPAPTPTPDAMDKDGADAPSIVDKNDRICTTPTAPEPGSRACTMALMAAAAAGFVPVLVVDKKGGLKAAPSPIVPQPRKAGSAPTAGKKTGGKAAGRRRRRKSAGEATGDGSALTPGKKLGCKISFASPKLTPGIAGVCPTPASVADQGGMEGIAGVCPTPASVADQGGMEASAALKQHEGQPSKLILQTKPRKLYPVTADEISDDPGIVLLALPSQALAASNA